MAIDIEKIDHVCLTVNSLKESRTYCKQLFGAKVTPRKSDAQTLVVELPTVRFFLAKGDRDLPRNQHLSFQVADIEGVKAELTKNRIPYSMGEVDIFERELSLDRVARSQ